MKAIRLRTEYLKNPRGIDIVRPRLFWNPDKGIRQSAYQILCQDPEGIVLWDSGKVESSSMQAEYPKVLKSRQEVIWKVRLWDENGTEGEWSEEAVFEMGFLDPSDWTASWISGDYVPDKKQRYPVDCFRKTFILEKPVKKARLYISSCGTYEAALQGKKIGDQLFTPGYTDYRKRVQYQVYDIKDQLIKGKNELTVLLADGWYRGSCGAFGLTYQYGTETKLLAQLEILFEDETQASILSDGSWDWSNDGPILFADQKDGEIVDARKTPSFNGKAKVTDHPVIPSCSNNVPVKAHERLHPVRIWDAPNGKKLLDFGQNLAGVVSFHLEAKEGQKIFLRFGELLDSEGNLTLDNIHPSEKVKTTPKQEIDYTCKEGLNEYQMRFGVFGFQYGELDSEIEIKPEEIESVAVYSDLERTGWFESSNQLLDQMVTNTVWSAKSNHLDIPTDCPTRERHGWTGDAQIFYDSAAYLFDFAAFGRKYESDMTDWQRKDGCFPHIVPDGGADRYMYTMNGSVGWADAGILIPYRMWKRYGDRRIIESNYDAMRRYAKFMIGRCGKLSVMQQPIFIGKYQKYLVNVGQSYGEWAEPADVKPFAIKDFILPHPEESTAYTAFIMGLMEEVAGQFGQEEDARLFGKYAKGCRLAYRELLKKKGFSIDTDRQAKLVRPLFMHLLDPITAEFARKRLIKALENYNWRLGTGFLSTPWILYVLQDIDLEAAYKLLENEELPGWLCMPRQGATTIWENWEGPNTDHPASLNHYSKGAVCEWLFSSMCGIHVDSKQENHFIIEPLPGGHFTHAQAVYQSLWGKVESGWTKEDKKTIFTIVIPANCSAVIKLPDGTKQSVTAGEYRFVIE